MKTLPFDHQQLERIASRHPTPFYIYDEAAIRRRVRALRSAFAWNAGYQQYYAVKACPNPDILKLIRDEGCGMDCSSYTELALSESIGVVGDGIMFSSNDTPEAEFEYARRLGAIINLDDITHIDFLKAHGGVPETVCCRFNPGGEFRLGNTIMGTPRESKFGFTREQITEGFIKLKALGVKRFGLHSFLASNTTDNAYYPTLAGILFAIARELHEELGVEIAFVNLSGGVGIPYGPDEVQADIAAIGLGVRREYERVFGPANMHPSIFTELGRYVTGPAGYLVTRAVHHKDTHKRFIGCDACSANLLRPAMYGAYHHVSVMGKEHLPHDQVYDIAGSLCESNDRFAIDRKLPKIDIGDLLVIHDAGAHSFSMGFNYNGKLRSAELMLKEDGTVQIIRRAETADDYFATFDTLGFDYRDFMARKLLTLSGQWDGAKGFDRPRARLGVFPTPFCRLENAGRQLGCKLYIKRDDMTGVSLGGNKVRKLEFLLADAVEKGCDTVLTTGGAQSNHAMLTAASCRRLGLTPILLLKARGVMERKGNLLLNALMDADVRFVDTDSYDDVYLEMDRLASQLRSEGGRPYLIPVGGSVPVGVLGYVNCAAEIFSQAEKEGVKLDRIVCCAGSGGTFAGLVLGAALHGQGVKVTGIAVDDADFRSITADLVNETAALMGATVRMAPCDIDVRGFFGAGYAKPSKEGLAAIAFLAKAEGIMLDPVYTGKTFAGLMDLCRRGEIKGEEAVAFVHTGGAASLFAINPFGVVEP